MRLASLSNGSRRCPSSERIGAVGPNTPRPSAREVVSMEDGFPDQRFARMADSVGVDSAGADGDDVRPSAFEAWVSFTALQAKILRVVGSGTTGPSLRRMLRTLRQI